MLTLQMGANAPLNTSRFEVVIEWPNAAGTLDCSAYLLATDGKVRSDDDMIFYNQRAHPTGAVEITLIEQGRTHFSIDLGAVPSEIQRIAICATIEEPERTMATLNGTSAMIRSNGEGELRFIPDLNDATEVALRLVEIYRRNGAWKLRADGQGFNDGLAPLARSFGIDVADDEAAPPHQHQGSLAQTPVARDDAPLRSPAGGHPTGIPSGQELSSSAPPATPTVDDGIVRLNSRTDGHRWESSPDGHFGAITAKLLWSSRCGGVAGRARPLELAFGCLYELQDGRRGTVQSWDYNGLFDAPPFIQLSPGQFDGVAGDQTLRINGEHWPHIKRLALYCFVNEGAPSWHSSSVMLDLSVTNRNPLRLELVEGIEGCGMVALVLLENIAGDVVISRLAKVLPGHQELDQALQWGLSWKVRNPVSH